MDVRDIEAVRAGESIITRAHLAEIAGRRAVADIDTLVAACGTLLDEMEHSVEMVVSAGALAAGCIYELDPEAAKDLIANGYAEGCAV